MGPDVVEQLIGILLDLNNPLAVRSQLPRILEKTISQQAVNGLLSGLSSHPFEIRYQVGQALARLKTKDPTLHIAREIIFETVKKELQADTGVWTHQGRIITNAHPQVSRLAIHEAHNLPKHAVLHHVIQLLGLVLDSETLQFCRLALIGNDTYLRGTALAYLENVLPKSIRKGLRRHIHLYHPTGQSKCFHSDIINELSHAARVLMGNRCRLYSYPECTNGNYTIIFLTGKLALHASLCAGQQILQHLEEQHNVLVDLSAVDSIDSFAVASFLEGLYWAKKNNLKFGLLRVQEATMQVLQVTHLDQKFPIFDSLEGLK